MEKKDLVNFLDNQFVPIGFKRKGNNWIKNEQDINKIINLQKSQYSNAFYINYSYNINCLPLNGFVNHISSRLGSLDKLEQERITDLLNLENDIEPIIRFSELEKFIIDKIVYQMISTNSEKDILNVLKQRKYLHTIPPHVLKHFNLTIKSI
ncbi:hypothetical protein D3C80_1347870 [compost metagenome]